MVFKTTKIIYLQQTKWAKYIMLRLVDHSMQEDTGPDSRGH